MLTAAQSGNSPELYVKTAASACNINTYLELPDGSLYCCRRLSALAAAAQAVQSATAALASLATGGEDSRGQPLQCSLLREAVGTAPAEGTPAWDVLQTIKSSLDFPQAPVKVCRTSDYQAWQQGLKCFRMCNLHGHKSLVLCHVLAVASGNKTLQVNH